MFLRCLRISLLSCLVSVFATALLPAQAGDVPAALPNIVLIFADDLGYGDLSSFGSETIQTPHIDSLGRDGMIFRDFYAATPMCSGSRAALLTGCYPRRINVRAVYGPNSKEGLNPDEVTIADLLKTQGYATACIGKWHLGDHPEHLPNNQGFDLFFGLPYSNDMNKTVKHAGSPDGLDEAWGLKQEANSWWDVPLIRNGEEIERPVDQTTLTDRYTQEATQFIAQHDDQPFFLYMPHTMPHVPLFVDDDRWEADPHKAYKLTIEDIDDSVGQVLQALEDAGVADKTLVIFTSDNGPWLGKQHHGGSAGPLRGGKFSSYEGGVREPTLMRWPGQIPAGTECNLVASTIDVLPTIAEITGAALPEHKIDGKSILPLMTNQPDAQSPHHDAFYYWEGTSDIRGVRMGEWKVLRPDKKKPEHLELYNLAKDISEETDLAAEHPDIVQRGRDLIDTFDKQIKSEDRPAGRIEG